MVPFLKSAHASDSVHCSVEGGALYGQPIRYRMVLIGDFCMNATDTVNEYLLIAH